MYFNSDIKADKIIFINYLDLAMTEQEIDVYSFVITVQSIKMKVKFPCKMTIDLKGTCITSEVSSNESNKFIFNQEVSLKGDIDSRNFQLTMNLLTDKGSKYIAGVVKLNQNQIKNQQGQLLTIPLYKCLDSEATCELRVDQVTSEKATRKAPHDKSFLNRSKANRNDVDSPLRSPDGGGKTKSEFQFPISKGIRREWQSKQREDGLMSTNQRKLSPGHNFRRNHNLAATHIQRHIPDFHLDSANRDKLIQAQVYKEGYQKLKDKYKRQAETAKHELNKRIALENNENNFKLQIMRLKLRADEQQKSLTQKNARIRQLQIQIGGLQKKELDLQYLKEENSNKDHMIKMLQDTIRTLNRDNDDLKSLNKQRFQAEQSKIRQLRNQIQSLKLKFESREMQLQRQSKMHLQTINQKQLDIKSRNDQLDREKKLVDELEKSAQNRMYEYERSLQNEKNIWKGKLQQMKVRVDRLQKEKAALQQQIKEMKMENEKVKTYIIKLQYDKKIINEESDSNKNEIKELKIIKDKYQQLQREHKLLNEDKNHLQKQLQRAVSSKQSNIQQLTKQYQQQIDYYKKIFRDADDKLKSSQTKNVQLQSQVEQKKNEIEKLKRLNDNLTKENIELKEKEKYITKVIKTKEQEIANYSLQMSNYQQKYKSGDQLFRMELEKSKEESSKLKLDYDSECLRVSQLTQNNMNISNQLNKTKLQLQYAHQKIEKDRNSHQEKAQNYEYIIKELQHKLQENNILNNNIRSADKDNMGKIQKLQIQALKNNEKIDKYTKEIKALQEKVSYTEGIVKNKQNETNSLNHTKESLQRKVGQLQEKLTNNKNQINTMNGEKNKNQKIISLLQKDIEENKREIQKLREALHQKEKLEEQLRAQIKKNKEQYMKLDMRTNTQKKEYDKFRQLVLQTSINTYSQIPTNSDFKTSNVSVDISRKRDQVINNNDIINKIGSQNKEMKIVMSKMIENNKLLQAETERLNLQILNGNNKFHEQQQELHRQIQQLEEQMSRSYEEREDNRVKNETIILQLNKRLQDYDNSNKDYMIQVQQLNFTINSLRLDQDANNQHYNIKYTQYKGKIYELQEKIQYLTKELQKEEIKSHDLQERLNTMTSNYEREREALIKRDRQYEQIYGEKEQLQLLLQEYKKNKKELVERISQYQFKYNTQIQINQKTKSLLEDEEHKGSQLKQFISDLMKQKETAIRSQLQKSQHIITLESSIVQLTREKEMLIQETQRYKTTLEQYKDNQKKLNTLVKDNESSIEEYKGKQHKLSEKLREREKELALKEQEYENLKLLSEGQSEKMQKEAADLQSQLQDHKFVHSKVVNQLNDKVFELQKGVQEYVSDIERLKSENISVEESLFMEKRNNDIKSQTIMKLQEEITQLKSKVDSLQFSSNNLIQEIKEKEENMFQLSGKIYTLEVKLENKEQEKNQKIDNLNDDWSCKYDGMCEEYEQRLQLVQKEKDYFKQSLHEKEEQLRKCLSQLKDGELEDANIKKILQQKIKRLQDQRLSLISSKNSQIQKLSQENKGYFDSIKNKEADIRRLHHQLEIARSTIGKLDFHKKQTEEKIKNINKIYQNQLQQLKRKQASFRGTKQSISKCQWNIERQVKKSIQTNVKKLISGTQQSETTRIMQNIKNLQQSIINVIHTKLQEIK